MGKGLSEAFILSVAIFRCLAFLEPYWHRKVRQYYLTTWFIYSFYLSFRRLGTPGWRRYLVHCGWAYGIPAIITIIALAMDANRATLPCGTITIRVGRFTCFISGAYNAMQAASVAVCRDELLAPARKTLTVILLFKQPISLKVSDSYSLT